MGMVMASCGAWDIKQYNEVINRVIILTIGAYTLADAIILTQNKGGVYATRNVPGAVFLLFFTDTCLIAVGSVPNSLDL